MEIYVYVLTGGLVPKVEYDEGWVLLEVVRWKPSLISLQLQDSRSLTLGKN
jgi:hypothetical protein